MENSNSNASLSSSNSIKLSVLNFILFVVFIISGPGHPIFAFIVIVVSTFTIFWGLKSFWEILYFVKKTKNNFSTFTVIIIVASGLIAVACILLGLLSLFAASTELCKILK